VKPSELLAAALLQYVSEEHNGFFRGPTVDLLQRASNHFEFYDVFTYNDDALNVLRSLDVAADHRHDGMQPYIVIDCEKFRGAFKEANFGIRFYAVSSGLEYRILESYAEFGRPWLIEAIDAFKLKSSVPSLSSEYLFVPASDRIVNLTDNQIVTFREPIEDVVSKLAASNGDPEDPTFRSKILGQLKAGRELLDAGVFRLWLLKSTLLDALGALVSKYGSSAIGQAAKKLFDMLIEQIFKG
jgi:hypothetical protein